MAAQAWKLYNKAKKKIGNGTISLAGAFRIALVTSGSNFATFTISLYGSLTNEVASGNGYALLGQACGTEAWTVGASAKSYKFDVDDAVWTGTGGTIPNIKGAVIFKSGTAGARHLLAFCSLTSSQFTLGSGNTLTVQMASGGVFTAA